MYKVAFYGKKYKKNDLTPVEVLDCVKEYTE
jgi:acetaldehyde dehydrogenase/alcohol dehydrogenase